LANAEKLCAHYHVVVPVAALGVAGRLDGLSLELEFVLELELELVGSSALLACNNSVLNLSVASSVGICCPPLIAGVTGAVPLPILSMFAVVIDTTIWFKEKSIQAFFKCKICFISTDRVLLRTV
jgi:hypothetical protein